MADDRDQWAEPLSAAPTSGWLADEDAFDRRMLWRLGSWGTAAVGAMVVAILAGQSQMQHRRDEVASADILAQQSRQIQFVTKETQNESRRLSQAIETLNGDRDRLYSRVTSIEQGLESVTGSIKRQTAAIVPFVSSSTLPPAMLAPATVEPVLHVTAPPPAPAPAPPAPAPAIAPVAVVPPAAETPRASAAAAIAPVAPLMPAKSMMAPPDVAASKFSEMPAASEPAPAAETTASIEVPPQPVVATVPVAVPVPRTEFGVDLGGANSVEGLRALWRGLAKNKELTGLRPVMIVKERTGGVGMQLRLIAGPLNDAKAAAGLCATLIESKRACETTIFDGQRLALKNEPPEAVPRPAPAPRKRAPPKQTERLPPPAPPVEEPVPAPKPQSTLSSILGLR